MNGENIAAIVALLQAHLEPIERAELLSDALEGVLPTARKAAVLLGLFAVEGEMHLLFIHRATTLRSHSGEIAFPGGGSEVIDSSLVMTALREAQEEIGLDPSNVEILGLLHPVFTVVSNYLIVPVVAFLPEGLGMLQLQPSEVTDILLASVRGLADPAIFHTEQWTREGQSRTIYFYHYEGYRIWGATARILNELLELLGNVLTP